ncbi:hypothetical protein [Microvirga brassicacearum]|uniref:Uncharacterized protein n=1 Tax=Microvirga brassicacearum TaxID=2580413 RepID=A0A5N3P7W8_9HYPH|nr:hypothetical protein [Microvirga brassicacearum]KAB0265826.1 hypothetical protein FEZ63_16760 [Microvirga brassicacearum]
MSQGRTYVIDRIISKELTCLIEGIVDVRSTRMTVASACGRFRYSISGDEISEDTAWPLLGLLPPPTAELDGVEATAGFTLSNSTTTSRRICSSMRFRRGIAGSIDALASPNL